MQGEPKSHDMKAVLFKLLAMNGVSFCGGTIQILGNEGEVFNSVAFHDGFSALSENPIKFADLLCRLCLFQDKDPYSEELGRDFDKAEIELVIEVPHHVCSQVQAGQYSVKLSVIKEPLDDLGAKNIRTMVFRGHEEEMESVIHLKAGPDTKPRRYVALLHMGRLHKCGGLGV